MEKIKELKELAKNLNEKSSWIRAGMKEWMKKWAEVSECGEQIGVLVAEDCEGGANFYKPLYLVTGEEELQVNFHIFSDPSDRRYSWDALSMADIRKLFRDMPENLEKMQKELERKNKLSDKCLDFFKKFK